MSVDSTASHISAYYLPQCAKAGWLSFSFATQNMKAFKNISRKIVRKPKETIRVINH